MKNTNTKEFRNKMKAYLLPIIEEKAEGYGETIIGNPYAWLVDIAKGEVSHEFQRKGDQGGLAAWLQGLGLDIVFYNYDILQLAKEWHEVESFTEKEEDRILENYWNFMACKILQFSRD